MSRVAVGTILYGRCDQIQNVGHVAQKFFHVGYSPLIPLGSVFVLEDERVVKIPFSIKAMLFGYLRATLVWGMGLVAMIAFFALSANATINLPSGPMVLTNTIGYEAIGAGVGLVLVLVLTYVLARPSKNREDRLMQFLRDAGVRV